MSIAAFEKSRERLIGAISMINLIRDRPNTMTIAVTIVITREVLQNVMPHEALPVQAHGEDPQRDLDRLAAWDLVLQVQGHV